MADPSRGGLADVAGLRVGHATRDSDGWLTGTTVVLAPDDGMVCGVDVRGGAPGSRETDLLAPGAAVERVHALVLTGGSAYGLAAADGVMAVLAEHGIGFRVGPEPESVVPIVPAAVVFDLGRGGDFASRPDPSFGREAVVNALASTVPQMHAEGPIGAGTGVLTGRLRGGIGQASTTLPDGGTVAALVVANATGNGYDPATGELWASRHFQPGDVPPLSAPATEHRDLLADLAARARTQLIAGNPSRSDAEAISHTTLGIVATDLTLTKAQCGKIAAIAHDGLARAVNPAHTMFDGDLFFGVSTATEPAPDPGHFYSLLAATADTVTRAFGRALVAARTVTTPSGSWPGYLDLAPSALPRTEEDS
jgi:putative pantetheine hydrolase